MSMVVTSSKGVGADTRRRPLWPAAAPFRPLLDPESMAAQEDSRIAGDRGADPRVRLAKAGCPGVKLEGPQGWAHSAHPGRETRELADQRLSVLWA